MDNAVGTVFEKEKSKTKNVPLTSETCQLNNTVALALKVGLLGCQQDGLEMLTLKRKHRTPGEKDKCKWFK